MKTDRLHVTAALVFLASAAVTVVWCGPLSGAHCMGVWMPMPGQGWVAHSATFVGMWAVMMAAMMTPAFMPMLTRSLRSPRAAREKGYAARVALGYGAVWMLAGVALYATGAVVAAAAMRQPAISEAMPLVSALVVLAAGVLQLTRWKARRLEECRCAVDARESSAWQQGMTLGLRCVYCCANLTAVLVVIGVMDLLAMALVTMAISAERLMPARRRPARVIGVILLIMGAWLLVQSREYVPTTSASAMEFSRAASSTSLAVASSGTSSRSTFSANSRKW